jgi:hypothetical protein
MTFQFCDLALESSVSLPELPPSNRSDSDVVLRVSKRQPPLPVGEPIHRWELPDGYLWLSFSRHAGGYLLEFPGLATFFVADDVKTVRCWPHPGTPPKTIRHLFLDQVMPLILGRMGRAVLHASAVAIPDGAVAFAGEAGRGKSTLAGAFVNRGASLLTDDCLLLHETDGAFHVVPSYPGLRLWPDVVPALAGGSGALPRVCHYSRKGRLQRALPFASQPLPLRRLYLLADSADGISIAPLTPRDALIELVKCSYVLDVTDHSALKLQFETLSRVAALCLVCRLAYPRDLARLPELHAAITRHANGR